MWTARAITCAVLLVAGVQSAEAGINVWTTSATDIGGARVLVIDPTTPTTLYSVTSFGIVFKSTDGGSTWIATGLNRSDINVLAMDPTTPTTLYAGGYEEVFKSTDGGDTWSAFKSGFPIAVNVFALAIDPSTPTTLYAGTYGLGIFKSTNGGTS